MMPVLLFQSNEHGADRWALRAGLAFLEGATMRSWAISGLRGWFDEHLVARGRMPFPTALHEPPVGTVMFNSWGLDTASTRARLPALLGTARHAVLKALRGFLATPSNDRFVAAALFSAHVQRASSTPPGYEAGPRPLAASHWIPRPDPNAPLSTIVLSLFATDVLTHREAYDRSLCICDICGYVSFQPKALSRRSCSMHPPRTSGIYLKRT